MVLGNMMNNEHNYAEFLKRMQMVGQIDPWRRDDEGKPIMALLVPVPVAIAECELWSGETLTRTELVKYLKENDVFVFRNIDEFVKIKENNRKIEKEQKLLKKNSKRTISEERKKVLQKQAALMREKQKPSISEKPL